MAAEAGDQLPLAVAHRAIAFMLPEDRLAALERLAAECGHNASPLHRHDRVPGEGLWISRACDLNERRHDVDQMARCAYEGAVQPWIDPLRPIRDQRRRDPAFFGIMFEIRKWRVLQRRPVHAREHTRLRAAGVLPSRSPVDRSRRCRRCPT